MDEEQRKRLAQTSTLGSNLQMGGFGNPIGFTPPQPRAGINAQPQDVSRLPADNIDRSIISQGVPPFPAGAQATIARPEVPTTSRAMTGELRGTDYMSGGRTPVQTRYGTIYATESQMGAAQQLAQAPPQMTFEQRLADMREKGAAIGDRLAGEQRNRYYAFRQGIAERQAQEALSTERGRSPDVMRGAQATMEAERMRQAQQGRSSMSNEPMDAFGFQFQRGSMGRYSPVRSVGTPSGLVPSVGPQPATSPTFGGGFMASGYMPSFSSGGVGAAQDDWQRRNFPQDFFTGAFGSQGRRMIDRRGPYDQTRAL